jgi:hypothetical protein
MTLDATAFEALEELLPAWTRSTGAGASPITAGHGT